jgi:hypothetical protein
MYMSGRLRWIRMRMNSVRSVLFLEGGYSPYGFCIADHGRLRYTHVTVHLLIDLVRFVVPVRIVVFELDRQEPSRLRPANLSKRARNPVWRPAVEADLAVCGEPVRAWAKARTAVDEKRERFICAALSVPKVQGKTMPPCSEESFGDVEKDAPECPSGRPDAEVIITAIVQPVEDRLAHPRQVRAGPVQKLEPVPLSNVFDLAVARADLTRLQAHVAICDLPVFEAKCAQVRAVAKAAKPHVLGRGIGLAFACTGRPLLHVPAGRSAGACESIGTNPVHPVRVRGLFDPLRVPEPYPVSGPGPARCRRVVVSNDGALAIRMDGETGTEGLITIPKEVSFYVAHAA